MAEAVLQSIASRQRRPHRRRLRPWPACESTSRHDTFMRGDVYGTIGRISRGPKRLVLVKMDRSGRRIRFAAGNLLHADE
jgi:hypothetical protein